MKKKVAIKSLSWAAVSAVIIGTTAYLATFSLAGALVTALVSAAIKTPFYSLHEFLFEAVWNHKPKAKSHVFDLRSASQPRMARPFR